MTIKTTKRFSPEVRERAIWMVLEHHAQHPSRWSTILSIGAKVARTGQTPNEWVKQAERGVGRRPGPTTEVAARGRDLTKLPDRAKRDAALMPYIARLLEKSLLSSGYVRPGNYRDARTMAWCTALSRA
jgi:transposase